jgi:energy-coupling factor transporter ATP-binding protein EcfA2
VLNQVSLTFATGLNLLVDPSGAGKTTPLRRLATAARPSKGSIMLIWSVLLGLPAILHQRPLDVLTIASATGAVAGVTAIGLSALAGSVFAARLVLLAAWHVYLSF